jgi:predicted RNA-binding protein with PUA-like domain
MWLLKTEPSEYGWADLEREGRAVWDGVTNPVALRNLSAMREGDPVLVYHTGGEKAVVGLARVTREAFADPKLANPKRVVIEIAPVARLGRAVPLARIKALPELAESPLVRQGRLSVVPLTEAQWRVLEREGRP